MNAELQILLQAVVNGSEEAAREIFAKYRNYLLYLIRQKMHKSLRSRLDSIDIEQDVWASFFSQPLEERAFQNVEQFIGFLASLAHNKVADANRHGVHAQKRSTKREMSMDDSCAFDKSGLPSPDATPSYIVMQRDEWANFLRGLPPVHQEIFRMMRDGRSQTEIVKKLGLNDGFVRNVIKGLTPKAAAL